MKQMYFVALISVLSLMSCQEKCKTISVDQVLENPTEYVGKQIELGGVCKIIPIDSTNTAKLYFAKGTSCEKKIKLNAAKTTLFDSIVCGSTYVFVGQLSATEVDSTVLAEMAANGNACPMLSEKVAAEGKVTCYTLDVSTVKACCKETECISAEKSACKSTCDSKTEKKSTPESK